MNITNPEWRRADLLQAPSTDTSGGEEEVDVPTRPETWLNGNPMWAIDPASPIQLRMPPIPDPNRVFASLADSPEEMTDVPSVAQLRALWETQAHPMRYVDDDPPPPRDPPPQRRERRPFADTSDGESDSGPGSSEPPTQYYAG